MIGDILPVQGGGGGAARPPQRILSRPLKTNCDNGGKDPNFLNVAGFRDYLDFTGKATIDLTLYDMKEMKVTVLHLPYMTRWCEKYRNRTLAKFYKFNQWWEEQGRPPLTLLTLTTYQDSAYAEKHHGSRVNLQEGFEILKDAWNRLRQMMRNRVLCRAFDYLWAMEPHLKHDSGYPHLHVVIVGELTDEEKEEVKRLWSEVYNAGSREHGANFAESCLDAKKDIRNAGFYLFKYLGKGFCLDPEKMTPGELRFNTVLWEKGYRQWGASRNISKAMRLDKGEDDRFRFLDASVSVEGWQFMFREASEEEKEGIREDIAGKVAALEAAFSSLDDGGITGEDDTAEVCIGWRCGREGKIDRRVALDSGLSGICLDAGVKGYIPYDQGGGG